MICSHGGPLSHGSPVVVFFDRGHPRFLNSYSTIPVDVVRVKSNVNCLFDPALVVIRATINKLYFVLSKLSLFRKLRPLVPISMTWRKGYQHSPMTTP